MNEILSKIVEHPRRSYLIGGVVISGGLGLGYFLYRRKRKVKNQQGYSIDEIIIDEKIHLSPDDNFHEIVNKTYPKSETDYTKFNRKVVIDENHPILNEDNNDTETLMVDNRPIGAIKQNAFANQSTVDSSGWNYEDEIRRRSNREPYIIHRDEFFENELDYDQHQVTYYAGDDIVTDEMDSPIYNHNSVLGDLKFGHGSDDENIVYIRNDRRKAEYEVSLHEGYFSVEVEGLNIENNERKNDLKHSRIRKFRPD